MSSQKVYFKYLKRWEKLYKNMFDFKGFKLIISPRESGKSFYIQERLKQFPNVRIIRRFKKKFLAEQPKYTCSRKKIKGRGCQNAILSKGNYGLWKAEQL